MTNASARANRPHDEHFLYGNAYWPDVAKNGGLALERGEGIYVFDTSGNRYIEAISGAWHIAFGFSEQRLIDAMTEQMNKLPAYHSFFGRVSEKALELADRLSEVAPMPVGKVFFSNSGSEANETAIKMIWLINWAKGRPEKRKIISRKKAYHGSTIVAGSLIGKDYIHPFGLPVPEVRYADLPHHWRYAQAGESEEDYASRLARRLDAQIEAEGPETVAAFIADPVASAAGVIAPPAPYYEKLQAVLARHEVLLISDEVVTGLGRTGEFWGVQSFGGKPDIVTTSKVMSAGYYPIGATMVSEALSAELEGACAKAEEFAHGFTTGGSPIGAAVGLRVIDLLLKDGVFDHMKAVSPGFGDGLQRFTENPFVGEIRQVGLMGAFELVAERETNAPFAKQHLATEAICRIGLEHGLILRPLENSVIFAPPFVITENEIDDLFTRTERVMEDFGKLVAAEGMGA